MRYSLRSLRRTPLFTLTCLITLASAIAALATVLTLANSFFYRPLPADRGDLVMVASTRRQATQLGYVSYPDYAHVRDHTHTLSALAGIYNSSPLWVRGGGNLKELGGAVVSANFFSVLGATPALGRFFREEEDRVPDRDRVVVLGHNLWREWYGSSPEAIGGTLTINGQAFTIIGVAPEGLRGPSSPNDLYIPMMMLRTGYRWCDAIADRTCTPLSMFGRLAPGRTVDDAKAELATLVPREWASAHEGDNSGLTAFRQRGAFDEQNRAERRSTQLLLTVAGVLLLTCCINLAGLFIARGSARARELAIRAALGAGRGRLVRQLMTESLLLAIGGGALGLWLSIALTGFVQAMFYTFDVEGYSHHFDFTLDPIVIGMVLTVSILSGLAFGLLSSLHATRRLLGEGDGLKGHAMTSSRSGLGQWLVAVQAAAAVALAAVAAMLVVSARVGSGSGTFDPAHVAQIRLRPALVGYSPAQAQRFRDLVISRLEQTPGVESVSTSGFMAASGGQRRDAWLADADAPESDASSVASSASAASAASGPPAGSGRQVLRVSYAEVGARAFKTVGLPILHGREIEDRDARDASAPAIVNETFALMLTHAREREQALIDQTLMIAGQPHRIIGIVADVPFHRRDEGPSAAVFVPQRINPNAIDFRLTIRVAGDASTMLSTLVREANRVDPNVPITETVTLPFQLNEGLLKPVRLTATFLSYAAGLTLLLCGIGLYATQALAVSRRTKEMAIRLALGADPRGVLMMVIREGLRVTAFGALAGLAIAFAGTRFVQHLLYGSNANAADAWFYSTACAVVIGAGLIACWVPARRAARVEPIRALNDE
jgi:ABC-type lipoprotein release transport system permease subunit